MGAKSARLPAQSGLFYPILIVQLQVELLQLSSPRVADLPGLLPPSAF